MPDNSVTTHFFADEKSAVEALTRLEKKYEDLEHKIKHAHHESKEGAGEVADKLKEIGGVAVGMAVGFSSVEGAIDAWIEGMKEFRKEADGAALTIDKANRTFSVRTGASKETLEKVREGATAAALPHSMGEDLFAEIHRRGFSNQEIEKNFASTAGGFGLAQTATGASPSEFAEAMLKSLDRTAKHEDQAIDKATRTIANMAGRGESRMTVSDVSAMGDFLARGNNPEAKGFEKRFNAATKLGLKLEDIDLVGEDFATAASRIKKGLDRLKPQERAATLQNLTGDADMAERVMSGLGAMDDNAKRHERDVAERSGGISSGSQRIKNEKEERDAAVGRNWQNMKTVAEQLAEKERGASPWTRSTRSNWAGILNASGDNADAAILGAYGPNGGLAEKREFLAEVKRQTALMEQGLDLQKEEKQLAAEANEQREKAADKGIGKPKRGKGEEH